MGRQQDIRWLQRFENYQKALLRLQQGVDLVQQRSLSDLEQQGLIQVFEFTHELAWNLLKDFLTWQGVSGITGSRDATRAAFKVGLIESGEVWMAMIKSRNLSSHTYREDVANEIAEKITSQYFQVFRELEVVMDARRSDLDDA